MVQERCTDKEGQEERLPTNNKHRKEVLLFMLGADRSYHPIILTIRNVEAAPDLAPTVTLADLAPIKHNAVDKLTRKVMNNMLLRLIWKSACSKASTKVYFC